MVLANRQRKESDTQGVFEVLNEKGLHTRPSTELVKCANQFRSEIHLSHQGVSVNAKSLLGILMLAAEHGARIKVEADGPDAVEAIASLCSLAKKKFHMHY